MSNRVGELYNVIIENVIRETKTEFEESGDDPAVLDMLKKTWKKRLMDMHVTKQPLWAEPHRAPAQASVPGQIPAGIPGTVPGSLGSSIGIGEQDSSAVSRDSLGLYGIPPVKDLDEHSAPGGINTNGNGAGQNPVSTDSTSQHPLYVKDEHYGVIPSPSAPPGSAGGTAAAFNPLDSSKSASVSASPRPGNVQLSPELHNQIHNAMNNGPRVPQSDGPQDEELNSDLDDSEDELNSNDEDEDNEQTQIMLCLYEKVHKVKTRWKYTLKDGVANVNGLDYVFARATGESEW